jgi:triphosphoribosyl-dephospho-CoA synthase
LDIVDARLAYAAIRLANPGGLGRSAEADVAEEPRLTLLQAMAVAADRDRIAWNYANGFADILDLGIPRLAALSTRHAPTWATALLYLDFLAHAPDTHLLRKHGEAVAGEVQAMAERLQGRAPGLGLEADLLRLDADLKRRGLNPGTSADLTVATMFGCNLLAHLAHR